LATFYRFRKAVPAVDVEKAIADGENIVIKSCTISGPLEVSEVDVVGSISINDTEFSEPVSFRRVNFNGPIVEFCNCEFIGGVVFSMSAFSEHRLPISFDESRFHKDVSFHDTEFNRSASFRKSDFRENAIFANVVFGHNAYFGESIFRKEADFGSANFNGSTDFRSATFTERADFDQANLRRPANFAKVNFREDTVRKWLWKYVLRHIFRYLIFLLFCFVALTLEICKTMWKCGERDRKELRQAVQFVYREWRSRNRKEPSAQSIRGIYSRLQDNMKFTRECKRTSDTLKLLQASRLIRCEWERIYLWSVITDFYNLNTNTVMDGSSNPYLKRYIEEEQWLESWRTSRFWRKPVFVIWEITSHCGRSFWLWAAWAVIFVFIFAGIYYYWVDIVYNVSDMWTDKIDPDIKPPEPDFWTYMYYSIVTFTTLGFGDVIPLDNKARIAVWSEVVLGYILLAVLLTVIGNRVAKPS
jgi:hypothetical protein